MARYEIRQHGYLTAGIWDTQAGGWTSFTGLSYQGARNVAGIMNACAAARPASDDDAGHLFTVDEYRLEAISE